MDIKKYKRYFSFNFFLYILGRFKTIKYFYKKTQIIRNKSSKKIIKEKNNKYLKFNLNVNLVKDELEHKGFYSGLELKDETLKYLINLSNRSELVSTINQKKFISFKEVNDYNKSNDKPYCLLNLINPEINNIAEKISRDKNLLDIANNYLGKVNNIDTRIQWSPVCIATDKWRELNQQTVTFHYDVHHLNFLYIFFYLTECDKDFGAHELIKGSHINKKFFKHLMGSARQSLENLKKDYNQNDFIKIEEQAGCGFIEDTSCYHRARAPKNKPRLALQFRYY